MVQLTTPPPRTLTEGEDSTRTHVHPHRPKCHRRRSPDYSPDVVVVGEVGRPLGVDTEVSSHPNPVLRGHQSKALYVPDLSAPRPPTRSDHGVKGEGTPATTPFHYLRYLPHHLLDGGKGPRDRVVSEVSVVLEEIEARQRGDGNGDQQEKCPRFTRGPLGSRRLCCPLVVLGRRSLLPVCCDH